ncbi:hypothetical protein K438DRAFT_1508759, partial [Mycena galopus ATCC 62051]
KFGAVILYAPVFIFPGVFAGSLGAWVGQIYIASQLPVKRLMFNTLSIRAYGAQTKFNTESLSRITRYTRAARNYYNLNRWVSIRIDMLGATFSASLAAYLVYVKRSSAGDSGFINMA